MNTPSPGGNTQQDVGVRVAEAQSSELTGSLLLTFVPSVNPPVDDPAVQFVGGGREVPFRIPGGQTQAVFGEAAAARFQTGTVAGEIRLQARLLRGGVDVTPSPAPLSVATVQAAAPVISSLEVTRQTGGLTVRVRGFSTPRALNSAALTFTARSGANIQGSLSFNVPLSEVFTTWYASEASRAFGSQFLLTIPVTISGDPAEITGLSVTLTNAAGTSSTASAQF